MDSWIFRAEDLGKQINPPYILVFWAALGLKVEAEIHYRDGT